MMEAIKSSNSFKCVEKITRPLRRFLNKFLDDWSLSFAAMLSYYLLIFLLSMSVVVAGIIGLFLRNDFDTQQYIKDKIINSIATDNSTAADVKKVIDFATDKLTKNANGFLSIGIVFTIFGASRLFVAIDKCMCIIYRIPERGFIRQNLLAFAAVFILILIIPIMIATSLVSSVLFSIIPSEAGRIGALAGGIGLSLLTAFVFFEFIYWVIPNKKMSLVVTWCGSLIAAITLEIFITLFPFYVQNFMSNYTGQLGFAVILLLFFYYFATIIIVGAQINAVFFENYQTLGGGLGTCVSRMHEEYGVGDLRRPLIDGNSEPRSYTH
ncbi:unnamed protein product [Rotaria socialis]|uniref:YihY/virulence factor BrkB family protein n=1 Tax=Rotaria socialis TaxID=392032 RepID=A0A817XGE0_9BILA|nr:unnamed protein product [Rotaria socialis]CAF3398683.1 unnamed protein product [Rotaria socialis]CAF4319576.1 unnamed protein product [Rotaria socialis]CAF4455619.1 unnamed protein product [Rotaria socialis]